MLINYGQGARMKTKTIHIEKVPESLVRALKVKAAEEGRTMKSIIFELIENYLKADKGGKK